MMITGNKQQNLLFSLTQKNMFTEKIYCLHGETSFVSLYMTRMKSKHVSPFVFQIVKLGK